MSFLSELKRRNVIRMGVLYVVGSWLILQVTELLVDILEVPDWTMRFILLLLLLGFPLALVFSWIYEMTPEGLKKEREVEAETSVTADTARKLNVVVIVLLVAVLATFAIDRMLPEKMPDSGLPVTQTDGQADSAGDNDGTPGRAETLPAENSVAILPFADLSASGDSEYFSDGLAETLLHMLAQVPELKVAARTSSFAFKGKGTNIRVIASELRVANILEGSVQRVGDDVRITAQLIRAADGFQIWSQSFDRKLDSIFAIQDEIAAEVSNALTETLLFGDERMAPKGVSTNNIDAYDLYLQALSEYQKASFGSLDEATELLTQAIAIDPKFVEAIAALGQVQLFQTETGMLGQLEGLQMAKMTAERALAIDPDHVEAQVISLEASGRLQIANGDMSNVLSAEPSIKAIVDNNPGEVAPKRSYAGYLRFVGRDEDALAQLERAIELDPLNAELHYTKGNILWFALNRFNEARMAFRESLRIEPEQPNLYSALGSIDLDNGDLVSFVQNVEIAAELDPADPEVPAYIANELCAAGLITEAKSYLQEAQEIAADNDYVKGRQHACVAAAGDHVRTISMARELIEADISNRRGSFSSVVSNMLRAHIKLGTLEEGSNYLEQRYPGFIGAKNEELPLKVRVASMICAPLYAPLLSEVEKADVAAQMREFGESVGRTLDEDAVMNLYYLGLQGEYAKITDVMVSDVFRNNVYVPPMDARRFIFEIPLYQPLADDPAIKAGLDNWDRRFELSRDRLLTFFEERER